MRLHERVDGRVRPDKANVEGTGENRGHGVAAGVEGVLLDADSVAKLMGEEAVLQADQRGRVGEVREIAEPDRERPIVGPRRARPASHAEEHHRQRCDEGPHRRGAER